MLQAVASTATTAVREQNPHFNDPQVKAYTAKLKERIRNLADKGGKSLLLSDAFQYGVKPHLEALKQNTVLGGLWAGGVTNEDTGVTYGSSQYNWFIHALATVLVNTLLSENVDNIFGASGKFRDKVNAGVVAYRNGTASRRGHGTDDYFGLWNYLKRTFSRAIKNWYITKRLVCIPAFSGALTPQFLGSAPVAAITQAAVQAKAANQSVGAYVRTQMNGKIAVPDGWGRAATMMQVAETEGMTGGASTSSSSSSRPSAPRPTHVPGPRSSANPFGNLGPRIQQPQ